MPLAPPAADLLDQPPFELMELYGRMRSFADSAGFEGVLPAVWQCSDESQGIKKALFGYVFDCPVFNLGRVGALIDPTRLLPASHHGRDLVILGGSHIGSTEQNGLGYVERVHGEVAVCCGKLSQVLGEYLNLYRRASSLITVFRGVGGIKIEIPYFYLFRKPPGESARIHLRLGKLVDGEAVRDGSHGKIYRAKPSLFERAPHVLQELTGEARAIGELLAPELFTFSKRLDATSLDPLKMLENSVFDFLPEIVTSPHPHRRLADVNTWRQFHRLVYYLTESLELAGRNILIVAGLTLDHSIRRNTFVPQFGFLLQRGDVGNARYFAPPEINAFLAEQGNYRPTYSFLEYAGVELSSAPTPDSRDRPGSRTPRTR